MGNPKGSNAGNCGKKGRSGRKSAFEEQAMAGMLNDAFFKGVDKVKLVEKLGKKKIKLFELVLAKAIKNEGILMALFAKLYPDKLESVNTHLFPQIKVIKPPKKKKNGAG